MKEIEHRVHKSRGRITRERTDNYDKDIDYRHEATMVSLDDGRTYVIDLSGAQYGQYKAVMPLAKYKQEMVTVHLETWPFGRREKFLKEVRDGNHRKALGKNFDMRVAHCQNQVVPALNAAVKEWEAKSNKSVAAMLKGKQAVFEAEKDDLVKAVGADMRSFVEFFEQTNGQSGASRFVTEDGHRGIDISNMFSEEVEAEMRAMLEKIAVDSNPLGLSDADLAEAKLALEDKADGTGYGFVLNGDAGDKSPEGQARWSAQLAEYFKSSGGKAEK